MKHLTYADKSLLMDDDTADWLLEYARALGNAGSVDTVLVKAIGVDGNEVTVTFLLNGNTQLSAESATSAAQAPANGDAIRYMQDRVGLIVAPPEVRPESGWTSPGEFD